MLTTTVQQAAKKRQIKNAYQLQVEFELSPTVAAELWKGETLPRLQTLEKLCDKWRCSIEELVKWTPKRRQKNALPANGHGSSRAKKSRLTTGATLRRH